MLRLSVLFAVAGLGLLLAALPRVPDRANADAVAHGRAVFAAKGCAVCHRHQAIADSGRFGQTFGDGATPDLTNRPLEADYLRRWLKDPAAVRPNTSMPNLELSEAEIEALIVFLRAGAKKG
jgi:mono/diheme cytochrome c family protein